MQLTYSKTILMTGIFTCLELVQGPLVWGAPPEAPGTGLAATVYATRHLIASGRPRRGSGSLPDAILKSYLSHGGQVRLKKCC